MNTHIASPQTHYDYWLRRGVLRAANTFAAMGGDLEAFSFLHLYLDAARQQVSQADGLAGMDRLWAKALSAWEGLLPRESALPLLRLRHAGLHEDHLLAMMLVGLVEVDARFGALYG